MFIIYDYYTNIERLINIGLENRAIAPTLLNATSSRSHTLLTINIEQILNLNNTISDSSNISVTGSMNSGMNGK